MERFCVGLFIPIFHIWPLGRKITALRYGMFQLGNKSWKLPRTKVCLCLLYLDGVTCVNYDPEGKKLVSCSIDLCIKVWNAEKSYQCISTFYGHEHTVSYVSFILGDSYILSSSRDFKIKLWDSQNGSVKREFLGHTGWVRKLAITKDYIHFVSCSGDQIINVWMLEKEKPIFSFKISGDVIENVAIIEKQSS